LTRPLIAVDWGTSSLRVALLDERGHVTEERDCERGILSVPPGEFPSVLGEACSGWPDEALTLVCGMAGSRQGWAEAPYCACPAGFEDVAAKLLWVDPGQVAIVPGMSCEHHGVPDVMRGEETQVFGALALLALDSARLVLPGTHSKWVRAIDGEITGFSTFMTGEVYALLRQHSILGRMMPAQDGRLDEPAFRRGVEQAFTSGNLLKSAFSARTLSLFGRIEAPALPSYLSGLVIGEELRAHQPGDPDPVVIVGSDALAQRYAIALQWLGIATRTVGAQASWQGLWAIAQTLEGPSTGLRTGPS
jgi:2-dehydro-3-deoxygalactonokinase